MQAEKKQRTWALPVVGFLLLLVVLCGLYTRSVLLPDAVTDPAELQAFLEQTLGDESVTVQATAESGSLFAVCWQTDLEQGLLLLERSDGLLSGGWRILDQQVSEQETLHIYQNSLNGVISITALYGENLTGASACSMNSTGETRTLEADAFVLELFVQTGNAEDSEALMIIY